MALRTRNAVVLAKVESSEGVDASPTAGSNALKCTDVSFTINPNVIDENELGGGLGAGEPVIGATPVSVSVTANLRGPSWSSDSAVASELTALLRSCSLNESVVTTPDPATSTTACTGGSSTTATLATNVGNGTDWDQTTDYYAGRPITFGGNMSGTYICSGSSYGTNTLTLTFAETLPSTPTASATVKCPGHVLYTPHSGTIPSSTIYVHRDGLLWKALGARGDCTLTWGAGGKGTASFTLQGSYGGKTDVAVPTPTLQTTAPPIWVAGVCVVNRIAAAVSQFSIALNCAGTAPENPNATEGIDPYVLTGRSVQGQLNPLLTLVGTQELVADLRANTKRIVLAKLGSATGNRLAIMVPNAKFRGVQPGDRNGVLEEQVAFQATGNNSEFYLAIY